MMAKCEEALLSGCGEKSPGPPESIATHTSGLLGSELTAAHCAVRERGWGGQQVDLCESATEKSVLKKIELAPTGGARERINVQRRSFCGTKVPTSGGRNCQ